MNTTRSRIGAIAVAIVLAGGCAAGGDGDEGATDLPTLQTEGDATADAETDEETDATGDGGDESPPEDVDPEIAMAEYEQCLSDQGIDVEFGSAGDGAAVQELEAGEGEIDQDVANGDLGGTAFEDFEAAAAECDAILDDAFGDFELSPEQEAEMADQMLELERCLSDRGFEIDVSGNAFELGEDIDFEAFEAAMSECEPDLVSAEVGP